MRTWILIAALALTGCGGKPAADDTGPGPSPDTKLAPTPDLVKPVAAPMRVRDKLLHDLKEQKAKARDRRSAVDQVFDR